MWTKPVIPLLNRQAISRSVGVRNYSSIKFPQAANEIVHEKPNLSQFKNPLLHTFLIASSTYMVLHIIALIDQYDEEEKILSREEKVLEEKIQSIIDETKIRNEKSWYSFLWKSR
ncbi:hypothetical protein CANTEDRAFT_102588 [Yamadazyma tenuis ATCC 10573]|uniref:Uncharacterized protein n=1 Tax=Candida tenuis (strain ATCC 10573 / BCRC 21748 / CBS 615 / JCM 9827 / NBRC 10315 / NRRL Y-1498 / VKM Y-70) TaxID=590646 RepID=G3AZR5_CANTC|nr:uncharacterized protein CANTEDRAFT_102588 [Yamadazyma tenuis ATCC 10573]EGV65221.1 hypothetical protein CANTEDRAFT_102588 [Yamadazyma tenuis ATCC 10573]